MRRVDEWSATTHTSYYANDNKTAESTTGGMSPYGFETGPSGYEDRLTNWQRDDTNLDLSGTLSDVGNWDAYTVNTLTQNRTHNAVHELTAIDSSPLTYDPKGNLTGDEAGIDYAWDADNMLSEADVPATPDRGIEGTHAYAYDALGRRVSKTVDDAVGMTTTTTVFVCLTQPIPYSPWAGQVLAEYTSGTAAGSPLRKYAYGEYIDEPLAMIDRTSAGSIGAGSDEPFYYHRNQQYSLVALSDSGGNVTERYRYTPYGETTILAPNGTTTRTASDVGNPWTYTGRRLDGESGLHYFRARFIKSTLGRFVNRDPLSYVDGVNLYHARFILVGMTDPSGAAPDRQVMGPWVTELLEVALLDDGEVSFLFKWHGATIKDRLPGPSHEHWQLNTRAQFSFTRDCSRHSRFMQIKDVASFEIEPTSRLQWRPIDTQATLTGGGDLCMYVEVATVIFGVNQAGINLPDATNVAPTPPELPYLLNPAHGSSFGYVYTYFNPKNCKKCLPCEDEEPSGNVTECLFTPWGNFCNENYIDPAIE